MSVKDKIDFVKKSISTEEKFLENVIRAEEKWGKYKRLIITFVVVCISAFVGNKAYKMIEFSNLKETNMAFGKVLENSKDEESKNVLRDLNPKLLEISKYMQNVKDEKSEVVDVRFLSSITKFNNAIKTSNIEELDALLLDNDFILKEYALLHKAIKQAENNEYEKAKETLASMKNNDKESSMFEISKKLKHHLLTK